MKKTLEFLLKDILDPGENNKKELDKCVLVCSNCHREIHAGLTLCP